MSFLLDRLSRNNKPIYYYTESNLYNTNSYTNTNSYINTNRNTNTNSYTNRNTNNTSQSFMGYDGHCEMHGLHNWYGSGN
jgi:hypothetical protein